MRMVRERLPDDGLPGGTRTRHEITAQDVARRVGIAAAVAPAENHIPKRTSTFIHAGAAHFHAQKMGKLQ